ncbi:MAG: MFS transporter [Planctomycetaceae bacterium]
MKLSQQTWAWSICGLLLLATMLNYMDRQALAVTLPTLKANYNLTESRVGMLEGCFGFSFAFGSILFGWLADRWGPRLLYPFILAGWSLAGVATAAAGQPEWMSGLEGPGDEPGTGVYRWLLICRVALGMCEAGHWPCALLTVRAILTAKDRPLGNGILQSGASIGAISVPIYIELADRWAILGICLLVDRSARADVGAGLVSALSADGTQGRAPMLPRFRKPSPRPRRYST